MQDVRVERKQIWSRTAVHRWSWRTAPISKELLVAWAALLWEWGLVQRAGDEEER